MSSKKRLPKDVDEYIAFFPPEIGQALEKIRQTIAKAAPQAKEAIKYGMPTFILEGNLVHFAAFRRHIGIFPPVKADEKLKKELAQYAGPKGNLQFPLDARIPHGLIAKVVKLRVKENLAEAEVRKSKRR